MFYRIFIFFALIFISNNVFGQEKYEYLGVIQLTDTTLISYKIIVQQEAGVVSGHSITDLGGAHETKSMLTGVFNDKENTLQFKESGIVYTKSPIIENDFCFVHFSGRLKKLDVKEEISGKFKGLFSDGEECISGTIQLARAEKIVKKLAKVDKKIDRNIFIKKDTKKKIDLTKRMDTLNMSFIRKGEVLNVFSKDEKVTLSVYDSGKQDGDRIKLLIDGKVMLEDFTIGKNKKTFIIPLVNKQTSIEVIALNVGTSAPNTARLEVLDSRNIVRTLTNINEGEKAGLLIVKQK